MMSHTSFWQSYKIHIVGIVGVVTMVTLVTIVSSCRLLDANQNFQHMEESSVKATSPYQGELRCGGDGDIYEHNNIYNDLHDKSVHYFKILSSRIKKDPQGVPVEEEVTVYHKGQQVPHKQFVIRDDLQITSYRARKTLIETPRMLLNMMGDRKDSVLPDRPLHPAAFMSVIRDFEANKSDEWSSDYKFNVTAPTCNGQNCYGMFQIHVQAMFNVGAGGVVPSLHAVCGDRGLGFLSQGVAGALDFCSAMLWWNGSYKCQNLRLDPSPYFSPNMYPSSSTGDVICVPIKQVDDMGVHICNRPQYPWRVDHFSYAYFCAYGQHNQWGQVFGIHETWGAAYTGFDRKKYPKLDQYLTRYDISMEQSWGYEQCAVARYLKELKKHGKCIEGGEDFNYETRPPKPNLLRATVAHYACQIDLLPSWVKPEDCDRVNPAVAVDSYGRPIAKNNYAPLINTNLTSTTSSSNTNTIDRKCIKGQVRLSLEAQDVSSTHDD